MRHFLGPMGDLKIEGPLYMRATTVNACNFPLTKGDFLIRTTVALTYLNLCQVNQLPIIRSVLAQIGIGSQVPLISLVM